VKTLEMLRNCFGNDILKKTAVYEWHERFKSGHESVEDFMDYNDGIVHHEFLPEDQTVNKEYYLGVMRRLREAVRQKKKDLWANNSWILHHDNAPLHNSHHYS